MGRQICGAKGFLRQKQTSYRAPNLDLHSHYWWLHSLRISCDSAARLWRFRLFQITSSIPRYLVYSIKRRPTPKVNKLQIPKFRLTQSLLVATFTQNFMQFRCTVTEKRHQNFPPHSSVCDDRYMPVHLYGTNFAPFLLLTRRCYDAKTSAILLLLKRAFA